MRTEFSVHPSIHPSIQFLDQSSVRKFIEVTDEVSGKPWKPPALGGPHASGLCSVDLKGVINFCEIWCSDSCLYEDSGIPARNDVSTVK